jgi:hypothetical protein
MAEPVAATAAVMDRRGRNVIVELLGSSLHYGGSALADVPDLVIRLLRAGGWTDFVTRRGEVVHHDRFAEFVTTPPLKGLGATLDMLRRICKDSKPALDLIDQALQNPAHIHADVSISNVRPSGTTDAAALRRLRKDRPDLHADVLTGRLSAHAAMVRAGFRPRTISVPVGRPQVIARALIRHLTADDLRVLRELLDVYAGSTGRRTGT